MLRRTKNPETEKLRSVARRRAITVEQLRAVVGLVGWDPAALDAAAIRLRGYPAGENDNPG